MSVVIFICNDKTIRNVLNLYSVVATVVNELAGISPLKLVKLDFDLSDRPCLICYATGKYVLIGSCANSCGCNIVTGVSCSVAAVNNGKDICKLCRNVKSNALLCTVIGKSANVPSKLGKVDVLLSIPNELKLRCAKLVSVVG